MSGGKPRAVKNLAQAQKIAYCCRKRVESCREAAEVAPRKITKDSCEEDKHSLAKAAGEIGRQLADKSCERKARNSAFRSRVSKPPQSLSILLLSSLNDLRR